MIIGFVRFLFILAVIYLGYKIIQYLLRGPGGAGKKEGPDIRDRRRSRRKVSRDVGEYVDYEEVDDD